jgi:hypothetical protein
MDNKIGEFHRFWTAKTNISTSILMKNIITNTHTYACNMRMTKLQKS